MIGSLVALAISHGWLGGIAGGIGAAVSPFLQGAAKWLSLAIGALLVALYVMALHLQIANLRTDNAEARAAFDEAVRNALTAQLREAARAAGIAAAFETQKEKSRVVYRTIEKQIDRVVERPVYLNQCLDDDGLRLLNDAIAGRPAAAPGEPDGAVRAGGPAR